MTARLNHTIVRVCDKESAQFLVDLLGLDQSTRTAMPATVMRDGAKTVGRHEDQLVVPGVGIERPAMAEHDRLPPAPVLIENRGVVIRSDRARRGSPYVAVRGLRALSDQRQAQGWANPPRREAAPILVVVEVAVSPETALPNRPDPVDEQVLNPYANWLIGLWRLRALYVEGLPVDPTTGSDCPSATSCPPSPR